LVISEQALTLPPNKRYGLLTLQPAEDSERFAAVEVLSPSGSMREAASNLFAALRRLDAANLDAIVARPVPEVGLGRAIMDRLRRAAAR
jgi:L-threonylcarbamoyladenylate synthase